MREFLRFQFGQAVFNFLGVKPREFLELKNSQVKNTFTKS